MAVEGIYMDAFGEIGRNPSSKHQIQPEREEWAGWRETGQWNLSCETKFSGANRERESSIFRSSADNKHIFFPVDPYSAESADPTYLDSTPSPSSTYARMPYHGITPS